MKAHGFIDLHTHGIGRYDTRGARSADILKMAGLHGREGVTAILPAIYPAPIDEMRMCMAAVREAMKAPALKGAARILGVNLEGPFLNPRRCGALNEGFFIEPRIGNLNKLIDGYADIIKIITIAPELKGALKIIERCASLGIRVNMGHSDATFKEALDGKMAGATGITHLFNAMRLFHHREPGLAGLGFLDEELYVEIIGDGIHLSPETLKLVFKVKPKDRIILVSDLIKGSAYIDGVLQGGKTSLIRVKRYLSKIGIPKQNIEMAASENPARYIGK